MIFYFTGTGNSLYVAKNLDTEIISIPQIVNSEELIFEADKIGIVCPIYGHEMPAMVKEFIRKATFNCEYLYVVLTYGSRHATAVELADKVLRDAGKQADYITTILMADNFLPGFDMEEQAKLDKKADKQIAEVKADIQISKKEKQEVTQKDEEERRWYLNMVENAPETVWADFAITDDCIGCGICTKVCPAGCIELENQKAVRKDENCQACMACIQACPKIAIKMNIPEKNPKARYRNEHIRISEIIAANNQTV